jgi:diaminohydroxyphosphoribosylaminopyrimidine deaminase / 5-amino-6-(5-phosphoribosylamino)uracil reductase
MIKHDHTRDELYMRRALQLAEYGRGVVSPNPLVGSVIVHNDLIIGEGWHREFGGPHAEVNAVNSVTDRSLLKESTVYVNLEPCSHYGKTPPCADLLIKLEVKKVVIANLDSNPKVAGNGIKKLREAGVEVITGIMEKAGHDLNKRFFTFMEKKRPYIILKWAETSDGFIARENFDSKWISNELSRQLVHKWRAEEDSILVGTRTAAFDNPLLNVRDWTGRNPTRIVLDRFLKLNERLNIFDGSQPTFCYNLLKHEEHKNLKLIRVGEQDFVLNVIHDLQNQNIQSVLVEGGASTLKFFIDLNLWDEIRVFKAERAFGKGISSPAFKGRLIKDHFIEDDRLFYYLPC